MSPKFQKSLQIKIIIGNFGFSVTSLAMNEHAIERAHSMAVAKGSRTYKDPQTGYLVFTELALRSRQNCCGCGCRHCPYAHEAVPSEYEVSNPLAATLINKAFLTQGECDVVFWSGGKDSYLAYLALLNEGSKNIVLLTTFGVASGIIAHQDIPFRSVIKQAKHLNRPMLGVPLYTGDYLEQVTKALQYLTSKVTVKRLVFGDLHLQHIRNWRETQFKPLLDKWGLQLYFPLWMRDPADLWQRLQQSGAKVKITAMPLGGLGEDVGIDTPFTKKLMDSLPSGIDKFGENGEFHTIVYWE